MSKPKRRTSAYANMSTAMLCKVAYDRGIENYFPKYDNELIEILEKWDADHGDNETYQTNTDTENVMGKKKDQREEIDELDEELDIDDGDLGEEETVTEKVNKRLECKDDEDDDIDSLSDDLDDDAEDKTEEVSDDLDEDDDLSDEEVDTKSDTKSDDDDDDIDSLSDDLDDEIEDDETSEKDDEMAEKKAPVEKKKAAAEKKAPVEKKAKAKVSDNPNATSPFQESSAGHHVYMILTKAKNSSMEKITEAITKRIEKAGVKAPASISGKIGIIIAVINSGQKGEKWGKFTKDGGRVTFVPFEG